MYFEALHLLNKLLLYNTADIKVKNEKKLNGLNLKKMCLEYNQRT